METGLNIQTPSYVRAWDSMARLPRLTFRAIPASITQLNCY